MITVDFDTATSYVIQCMKAKLSCMIQGSPGIGKSAIPATIAKRNNLILIDERMSTKDPVDMSGMPRVGDKRASFVPFDTFPLEDTPLPKGKNGWLIFLDEMNTAPQSVQVAAYQLILDRMVGKHKLHPKAFIVAAGNLATDGAIVNRMGTAMQSRLIHMELHINPEAWIKWGSANGIDHRILGYIQSVPGNLFNFDPKHNDVTFSSPRTWEFMSKLIKGVPTHKLSSMIPLWAGTIGEGVATEFVIHTEVYTHMPSYDDIVADPFGSQIKHEPAWLFAVSHMISAFALKKDIAKILKYIGRLGLEFQTIILQNTMQREPTWIKEPEIKKWILEKGMEAF